MRTVNKILYIIGSLDIGGSEQQLIKLAVGLDRSRFNPVVCCLSKHGALRDELTKHGVRVEIVSFRGLSFFRHLPRVLLQLGRLVLFIKRERPDIIHCILFWAYIIGTYAAKMAGVPIVIASRRGLGHFKANKPHDLFLERLANQMTDLIVANSEAVKEDVIREEKVEPSRIRVIHNGVDLSLYDVQPETALRTSLGIPERARVIGVVANLIHYKGHGFFLRACQEIKRKHPATKFLLIGEGPLRGELMALAKGLELESDVLFLGSRPDVPRLLALMDVVVLPSLEEGFPNAVLEAMAARKPVVASRVGGVPEAVVHGETGILVPPKDPAALAEAIRWLLEHPVEAARFGEAGRHRVAERFDLSTMVLQYEVVYERLVGEKCSDNVSKKHASGGTIS
ncbi:MAG: glycosyltransferase [candidate division NC10 bacterium]|nr:glycosyltransferase [candidate division NC10 bacterium]